MFESISASKNRWFPFSALQKLPISAFRQSGKLDGVTEGCSTYPSNNIHVSQGVSSKNCHFNELMRFAGGWIQGTSFARNPIQRLEYLELGCVNRPTLCESFYAKKNKKRKTNSRIYPLWFSYRKSKISISYFLVASCLRISDFVALATLGNGGFLLVVPLGKKVRACGIFGSEMFRG